MNDVIERLSDYSKQKELEADSLGHIIFTKAGYDSDEAIKMLYVLLYSHLSFDELPFSSTFFDRKNYTLPTDYLTLNYVAEISDNSDFDISLFHSIRIIQRPVSRSSQSHRFPKFL